jgi:hypothetical protein
MKIFEISRKNGAPNKVYDFFPKIDFNAATEGMNRLGLYMYYNHLKKSLI